MLLIERTGAWDVLQEFADEDWEAFGGLIKAICDHHQYDSLDYLVSNEFPNGVERDELEEFFRDEIDFIFNELEIDKADYYETSETDKNDD